MKKTLTLVLFLAIVSGVSGLVLGFVDSFTAPIIEENNNAELFANLRQYFPDSEFENITDQVKNETIVSCYKAGDDGYAFELTGNGFGGTVRIFVAFDGNGTIVGLSALEEGETDGYGKENFKPETIESLYIGKTIDEEVDMRAGSTVTSTAVKNMVSAAQKAIKDLG